MPTTPADDCSCLACHYHDRRTLLTLRTAELAASSAACPVCAQIARLARAATICAPSTSPSGSSAPPPRHYGGHFASSTGKSLVQRD